MASRHKSCIHLQRSLYLAPDEIRTCCQRFFVGGEMKGDVVLIHLDQPGEVSYQEVLAAKEQLLEGINQGMDQRCSGCPHLMEQEWPEIREESVGTLSIENHSLCNMKCSYCSETYYGGVEPYYPLLPLLEGIDQVGEDLHLAWGGGEPTARKDFELLFESVNQRFTARTQIVFTNTLKYSPVIQQALDQERVTITSSLDAGTEETFQQVRGSKGMEKVLRHLQRYAEHHPERVTIKYIFTEENFSQSELKALVENLVQYELLACNFLISADFTAETVEEEAVVAILSLFFMLYRQGTYGVSFDDHIYYRVRQIGNRMAPLFAQYGIDPALRDDYDQTLKQIKQQQEVGIVLWGTGDFSRYLLQSSTAMQQGKVRILRVVDGLESNWGGQFQGWIIEPPSQIDVQRDYVVVASSNYYGQIVHRLLDMGVPVERIIPNFIL